MLPDQGLNLQPKYVPWQGIKPPASWRMGQCSNQLNHTGQGLKKDLKKLKDLQYLISRFAIIQF